MAGDIIASLPSEINKLTLLLLPEKLTQLITALKDKKTITRLSICSRPKLTDMQAQELAPLLSENLVSFESRGHNQNFDNHSSPNAIVILFQAMAKSARLEEISLQECRLNKPARQALSSLLSQENPPLRSLTLTACELNDQILESIASSMRENGSMTQLNFDNLDSTIMGNDITPIELTHIGTMLAKNKIESLSLRDSVTPYCMQALTDTLSKSKTLKQLKLRRFPFSASRNTALASYLGNHPSLLYLDLSDCRLDRNHSAALFNAMAQGNSPISFLDLALNDRLDFISLKNMLAHNKTIRNLILNSSLSNSNPAEAKLIFEALGDNESSGVTCLDLSDNTLHDAIIPPLINLLKKIRSLNLSRCQISYDGLIKLAEVLKENSTLTSLDLSLVSTLKDHNPEDRDFKIKQIGAHFQAALENNKSIIEFKLSIEGHHWNYTPIGTSNINLLLKRNREHHRITAATAIFQHGTAVVSNESKNAISAILPYILSFIDSAYLPRLGVPLATGYLRTISFFKENRTPHEKISHALSKLYVLCQDSHTEETIFKQLLSAIVGKKEEPIKTILDNLTTVIEQHFKDKDPAKITFTKVLAKYILESLPAVVEREQFKEFRPKLI